MGRNDRNRRHGGKRNWNGPAQDEKGGSRSFTPHGRFNQESVRESQNRESAIREFKARQVICPKCGQQINDMASAIADRDSGEPMHFDCVISKLKESETLGQNQSMTYIGQGRFAVITFENMRDLRHFKIEKIIEWEDRNKKSEWRGEMADLYSQVK